MNISRNFGFASRSSLNQQHSSAAVGVKVAGIFCALVTVQLGIVSRAAADDLAAGKAIYDGAGACFSCHGVSGKGDGVAAAALQPPPRSFAEGVYKYDTDKDGKTGTETDLFNIVTNGAAAYGGSPMMVARGDIAEADRKSLVKYVLSLKSK